MQGFLFVTASLSSIVGFLALVVGILAWQGFTGRKRYQPSSVPLA